MKLIDIPRYIPEESYRAAVDRMVNRLCKEDAILSIYQIGHVSTPGISDIDLVAVFADDACCRFDPRAGLAAEERYLFLHDLYGVCLADFTVGQKYSFFHNYVHLWGENRLQKDHELSLEEVATLKRQIALEYLVRMYISMTVEKTYGILKLRNLFLHVKGLLYDCDFLGITLGQLYDAVEALVTRREAWFNTQPRSNELVKEFVRLHKELARFLNSILCKTALCLPPRQEYRISRNIRLVPAKRVGYCHKGMTLPATFATLGRKYFNLQHRFNWFEFELPLVSTALPEIIEGQFNWQRRMRVTNRNSFPHFMPLSSSLYLL